MIKVGLSTRAPRLAHLVRRLAAHPDVTIEWIAGDPAQSGRVGRHYRALVGEIDVDIVDRPDVDLIDLYIGPCDNALNGHDRLKIILTDGAPAPGRLDAEVVNGVPEYNRKALVRGARATALPDQLTLLGALALMPAARNLLLADAIHGTVMLSDPTPGAVASATGRYIDPAATATLRRDILTGLQASYGAEMRLTAFTVPGSVAMATFTLATRMSLADVKALYHAFYDDHRHVVLLDVPHRGITADMVAGTNKAVIGLESDGSTLMVTVAADMALRTGEGMILHLLNLLFGLDERTGF